MIPKGVTDHRLRTTGLEPVLVATVERGVPLISRDMLSKTTRNTSPCHENYSALNDIGVEDEKHSLEIKVGS